MAERTICLTGGILQGGSEAYPSNTIKTCKYTWYSFLPKNLWEQLHKFGNVYFLVISVIMYVGEKTPLFVGTIKAFSTLGLLIMMMSVTAAMSLFDDIRRGQADNEINNAPAEVVGSDPESAATEKKTWAEVAVGDLLLVRKDEEFPADVVPLYCTGEGGHCYVSTANLDGETNLKLKAAPTLTQRELAQRGGDVESGWLPDVTRLTLACKAEATSSSIYVFNGSLTVGKAEHEALSSSNLLMRGTVLRNTAFCVGLVVYTGPDTRMVRNSRPAPLKQSSLEKITNIAMLMILGAQAFAAATSAYYHVRTEEELKDHWYLYKQSIILPAYLGWWLTFFTLYSNLMPISLYPTVEFCNAFQCYFIRNDKKMYYKDPDFNGGVGFGAKARSSNLCQELGQVGFIFSDKTGTLTQNDMQLRRVSIAGRKYGSFESAPLQAEVADGFNGLGDILAARQGPGSQAIDDFLEVLAVAHTVMVTHEEKGEGKVERKYEAESPDEWALVEAAATMGWEFSGRRSKEVFVGVGPGGPSNSKPRQEKYVILAVNQFNSTRKRMSVVAQKGSEYILMVKGADNVMLERAEGAGDAHRYFQIKQDLKEFSKEGLRTLLVGSRRLGAQEWRSWQARFDAAERETSDRERKLADVAEEVERSLCILGATAIEDKLQDGVPETIAKIRQAGIRLWVLTGDKLETARNIGFSTKVLSSEMNIQIVDEEEGTTDLNQVKVELESTVDRKRRAMMVTGQALQDIYKQGDSQTLLDVAKECAVLIACRVSPSQKADLVKLVREGEKCITLSVGDGANDVPMIQEAHVGVGIAGREGRQAVNSSDFAIAQFKYLQHLLFVHGRWNYRRACKFTLFTFWRNMVQVLLIMYYTWISGYSGTSLFEDWIRLSFNLLCTLPILPVGCTDEDVSADVALRNPQLYTIGMKGKDLNLKKTLFTMLAALAHSWVLMGLTLFAFPSLDLTGNGDYYTFGTTCYTCLLIDVNYRAAFLTNTHNVYTIVALVLSFALYVLWLCAYPLNAPVTEILAPNMYMVPSHMIRSGYFWVCVVTVPLLAVTLDLYITFNYHHLFPDILDRVEKDLHRHSDELVCKPDTNGEQTSLMPCENSSSGSEVESSWTSEDERQIALTRFGQREWWSCRATKCGETPAVRVQRTGVVAGLVTLICGLFVYICSESTDQVRIVYQEGAPENDMWMWARHPLWTRREEVHNASCEVVGPTKECTVEFRLHATLRPPIMVYYAIGPFHQNYNAYMNSEVVRELRGENVSGTGLREFKCVEPTRIDGEGREIVPCGMKATSFFNDTYRIFRRSPWADEELQLSESDIAWHSDVHRYKNLLTFPGQTDSTSWLFMRYPGIPRLKDRGVRDEHFIDWMRPSALPRVWNRYGLNENDTLAENETLFIRISSNFPMEKFGRKVLVLTEFHEKWGARHSGFGIVLIISGILCFFVGLCAWATTKYIPQGKECQRWVQGLVEKEPEEAVPTDEEDARS